MTPDEIRVRLDEIGLDLAVMQDATSWTRARLLEAGSGSFASVVDIGTGDDSERACGRLRAELAAMRARARQLRHERTRLRDELMRSTRWPVGTSDIGPLLGYPAATVRMWKLRGLLPAPAGVVNGEPFWWAGDVIAWAEQCGRYRGRQAA